MYGLETINLKEPDLLDRLLKNKITENAYREIQNCIATTPILAITPQSILKHLAGYGITLDEAKPHLMPLVARILRYFVVDRELRVKEAQEIQHLQALFNFTDQEVKQLQSNILLSKDEGAAKASLLSKQMAATVEAILEFDDKPTSINHSSAEVARRFYKQRIYQTYSTAAAQEPEVTDKREQAFNKWETPSEKQTPHQVLGIDEGATIEQTKTAYREKAALYHPDKASHLAPEFQAMAEQRMKGINAAYQSLRASFINSPDARADQNLHENYQSSTAYSNSEALPAHNTLFAKVWKWLGSK
jgi:DnaJ-domain-containing protein 1